MLTQPQVQRYAIESGLRDIMIAEKEVVLTFLLQVLSERGLLDRLAFKGGTCLRKMFVGSQGRFSTDLDFTGIEDHHHEDIILAMMEAFAQPFHGIRFAIPDESYYETEDTLSWGVSPIYAHDWNQGGAGEMKLQISRRETPTLPTVRLPHIEQGYFRFLPFVPAQIACLTLTEILAEKIRAFDWDDLRRLLRRTINIDRDRITSDCVRGFRFLAELTPEEQVLADDPHQRERALWERLPTAL